MAVPFDVCLDVSTVQFFLLSFHSVINVNYYGIHGIYRHAIPATGLQLWRLLSHATYECNLQEKITLINVSAACHIIIILPQKKRKK
jgi:hypothetical protein